MNYNKARRKKIEGVFVMICLLILCVSGCGLKSDKIEKTTLELKKDGSIVQTIIEDFPVQYSLSELEAKNKEEVDAYNNTAGQEVVTIKNTALENGKITVVMKYASSDAYVDINNIQFYAGTVKMASALGYDLNVKLSSVEDGKIVTCQELLTEENDLHLAIVTEPIDVSTFKDIVYVSDGVDVTNGKKLATIGAENTPAYIVFK